MNNVKIPGTAIHHVVAATGCYVGCPSIVVLPSGKYVASHSHFGPGSKDSDSFVYQSKDQGRNWDCIAAIHGQIWSKLFLHQSSLYMIGTDHCAGKEGRLFGKMVIRRSTDSGYTWSNPSSSKTGLLSDTDGYHTAPTSLVTHSGRIWKAFEFVPDRDRRTWRVFVISADENSDLLDRNSWVISEQMNPWSNYQWIEGNVVIAPDGRLVDILRTNDRNKTEGYGKDEPVAIVHISVDGKTLSHTADTDRVIFPGGGDKFTIRQDHISSKYLTLVNPQEGPNLYRNILSLSVSDDLIHWQVVKELLRHPDPKYHAFQYVDWDFDDEDIVYASRTAYDDGYGGANRAHDANFLTFHRIKDFRSKL